MLIFTDSIQVFVFTTNHHLNRVGGLNLSRNSVGRLTERPGMTEDIKQQYINNNNLLYF